MSPADAFIVDDFFGDGWFKPFCIINQWGITTLIAVFEILALNSIKRQVVSLRPVLHYARSAD